MCRGGHHLAWLLLHQMWGHHLMLHALHLHAWLDKRAGRRQHVLLLGEHSMLDALGHCRNEHRVALRAARSGTPDIDRLAGV